MIRLIGPGGAGKTTTGRFLAERLQSTFVDLDWRFLERVGDIGDYIDQLGYRSYAARNVDLYLLTLAGAPSDTVISLSSGFMTYPPDIHPHYTSTRAEIVSSSTTFVLLPSLDLEACVAETVRRQASRSFGRSPSKEEAVIRARHPVHTALAARKVETNRPVAHVVDEITHMLVQDSA